MAKIFVQVPEHWPDLHVTSYARNKGSHANFNAIDIALPKMDRAPCGEFWFYYFTTAFLLWQAQRQGRVYIAAPPECPHFHIERGAREITQGVELTTVKRSKCEFQKMLLLNTRKVGALNLGTDIENAKTFTKGVYDLAKPYLLSMTNLKNFFLYEMKGKNKYITVHGAGWISENDLQARLQTTFGDDSWTGEAFDTASQLIGYVNADDAKENALGDLLKSPVFAVAALGTLSYFAYQLAKEKRFWELSTNESQNTAKNH